MTREGVTPERADRQVRIGAVAVAGLLATALTIGGKLTAFARDVALSALFGAGHETDAFFIANLIPGILWAAFLTSINVVFLPIYVRERAREGGDAGRLAAEGARIYALLGLGIAVVCVAGAGVIVRLAAPEAGEDTLELARILTFIMASAFAFSGYVAVQSAIQQAHGHYVLPLSTPLVNNVVAIIGLFAAAALGDIRVAVAAAVFAWVVQAPIQRWRTRGYYAAGRWRGIRGQTLRNLTLLSVPVLLGTFLDQINIFVGLHLASNFGDGAISQLNYASRLALFLATTFSILISYFLFPRLSSEASIGDHDASARTLELGVLLIVGATLPLAVLSILLREDLIRLIYGRGAMSDADVITTAGAFAFFAIGAVFIAVRELFNRYFFSQQRNIAPLAIGGFAAIVNVVVSTWASSSMGLNGIALGASISALVFCVLQVALMHRSRPGVLGWNNLVNLAWLAAAGTVALVPTAMMLPALAGFAPAARLAIAGLTYGLLFVLAIAPLIRMRGLLPTLKLHREGH